MGESRGTTPWLERGTRCAFRRCRSSCISSATQGWSSSWESNPDLAPGSAHTVDIQLEALRDGLYLVSWQEDHLHRVPGKRVRHPRGRWRRGGAASREPRFRSGTRLGGVRSKDPECAETAHLVDDCTCDLGGLRRDESYRDASPPGHQTVDDECLRAAVLRRLRGISCDVEPAGFGRG
jgi:hypothetical protein